MINKEVGDVENFLIKYGGKSASRVGKKSENANCLGSFIWHDLSFEVSNKIISLNEKPLF